MRIVVLPAIVLLAIALAACGGAPGGGPVAGGGATAAPTGTQSGGSETGELSGTLGGDAQLEGGCAWLDAGGTRWQVAYPDGYTVTFDPLRLTGPGGEVAAEGDTVTVTGAPAEGVATICQVGPVWQATAVRPG